MMQKNLSCPNIRDAQKNVFTFSIILVFANLLFLALGALLYIYADFTGILPPSNSDQLYPMLALEYLSPWVGILFILGLVAAAYSSADSALTALTTSFCVDFLNLERRELTEASRKQIRLRVHVAFSAVLFLAILLFNWISNEAVINQLFVAAGYTYGPLLGLFTFGILTRRQVRDRWVVAVCVAAPVLSFLLNRYSNQLFGGFEFGFLILALNGLLTFLGLWAISKGDEKVPA
jgi:Na+/proline symporter